MRLTHVVVFACVLAGVGPVAAQADTLQMHSVADAPPNSAAGVPRPTRGMTMDQVRKQFGEPKQILPTVGTAHTPRPPITPWVYDKFTVYFEYNRVVHAVVHPDAKKK